MPLARWRVPDPPASRPSRGLRAPENLWRQKRLFLIIYCAGAVALAFSGGLAVLAFLVGSAILLACGPRGWRGWLLRIGCIVTWGPAWFWIALLMGEGWGPLIFLFGAPLFAPLAVVHLALTWAAVSRWPPIPPRKPSELPQFEFVRAK